MNNEMKLGDRVPDEVTAGSLAAGNVRVNVALGLKVGLLLCGVLAAVNAFAADTSLAALSDQQRIMRLERLVSSEVLREQSQTIRSLREEIAALRGKLEQQEFELESMQQRQRNLYLDMDRRINNVEAGGRQSSRTVAPVPPPVQSAVPSSATSVTAAVAGDVDGQVAYSAAFSLLKEGQYAQSIISFESFKGHFPNSKFADNAQYWLAEANYVSRDYKRALAEFQQLISQYPNSSKNPGARLKIGYVYFELKNWSAARNALQQVVAMHPDTTVAKKAKERMQRMKREGH